VEKGVFLGLDGRAALVTGAGSGVGRAVAFWLARGGCDVAIVDSSKEAAERVAEELREQDFTAIAVAADVRSERQVEAMVAAVVDKFDSLDVAVNCPATPSGRPGRSAARETERRSDLDGAVMASCCRAEARAMIAAGEGALVNVAWTGSEGRLAAVGVSPGESLGDLTRSLAAELAATGVRVNAILAVLGPSREAGKAASAERARMRQAAALEVAIPAEDLGRVAVFLASDLSRRLTGQVLRVDARVRGSRDRAEAAQATSRGGAESRRDSLE
jgi:NAD(P)-dependent dehydrogenase (short-subunit alcohol dehydrogenase family)